MVRRLTALAVLLLVLCSPLATVAFPVAPDVRPGLGSMTYEQAEAVYLRIDAAWRTMPAREKVPVIRDHATAVAWENEMLPYFITEGVVGSDDGDLKIPDSITFSWFPTDPDYALHVIGTTGFCSNQIELNQRIITPGDHWYEDDLSLVTLAHELAHIQGVCNLGTPIDDEGSAQIISWEIMAAMANSGCLPCRASLIGELRSRDLGAMQELAAAEGKLSEFRQFEVTHLSPAELASRDHADRYWASDRTEEQRILHVYGTIPLSAVFLSLGAGQEYVDGVQLPINVFQEYMPPGQAKPLQIDDLAYLWSHL